MFVMLRRWLPLLGTYEPALLNVGAGIIAAYPLDAGMRTRLLTVNGVLVEDIKFDHFRNALIDAHQHGNLIAEPEYNAPRDPAKSEG